MPQHDLQRAVVDVQQAVEEPLGDAIEPADRFCSSGDRRKRLHSIGVSVTDTTPEIRIATQMVTENSRNSRPRMPPMNSTGMNTAASDSVIDTMVKPISLEPIERRLERLLAHLHVPEDVLQHHDGVVHDEADREDQRHHRQVVEAVVQQVHDGERADDRERQRQAGMMVAETLRRNRKITMTTRPSVSSMVNCTSWYDSRMVSDRSYRMSMCTDGGSSGSERRQQRS